MRQRGLVRRLRWRQRRHLRPRPDAAHAAAYAAHAAAYAAYAARAARTPAYVYAATRAVTSYAADAAHANAADSASDATWKAVGADATTLELGLSPQRVAAQPLWPGNPPDWAAKAWSNLEKHLLNANEGWEVWTAWYEDHLYGFLFDKALEEARVLIPEETWGQGPKAVSAEIDRLIDQHMGTLPA